MRLLITTDTVGGVWSFTRDLTAELLRAGHSVALVSFGRQPTETQRAWCDAQEQRWNRSFHYTPSDLPLEWMQNNEGCFREGDEILQRVSDLFGPELLLSNQFCYGASSLRVPRVLVAHSDVFSWARACKPETLTPNPWLNRYTSLVQRGLLQADAVAAPTRWMLGALASTFLLPAHQGVIPNAPSITAPKIESTRTLQAVSAGRLWDPGKGLDLLLNTDLGLPVFLAGEAEFETQKAEAPSSPNVHLLGSLSPEALQQLFQRSALYLCTSRYEPFGLAPVEAAQCGCAVLARDLASLREVWGDDALYFNDAAELVAQIRHLLGNLSALSQAQQNATQRAAQYTVQRMARAYLDLFTSVLSKPSTSDDAAEPHAVDSAAIGREATGTEAVGAGAAEHVA